MASPRVRRAEVRRSPGKKSFAVRIYFTKNNTQEYDRVEVQADTIEDARAKAVILFNRPEKIDYIKAKEIDKK